MHECIVLAESTSGGTRARLNKFVWPSPNSSIIATPDHVLSLSVDSLPADTKVRLVGSSVDFADAGRILFVPANIPLAATCAGGTQLSLQCCISEFKLESLAGRPFWIENYDLEGIFDLPDSLFAAHMLRIVDELTRPKFGGSSTIELMINLIYIDLLRHIGRTGSQDSDLARRGGLADWQVRRIYKRIEQDDLHPPSVSEIANELGISSRHLLRGYRRATGITLQQHIRRTVEARALRLVVESDTPLKAIAQRLGFELQGSFSTAFRNAFGISPSELRRRPERDVRHFKRLLRSSENALHQGIGALGGSAAASRFER